jgi:hypothetical protein
MHDNSLSAGILSRIMESMVAEAGQPHKFRVDSLLALDSRLSTLGP